MAKFANDCLETFSRVTKQLETDLGPDTGDLNMRVGLHSGPTTAGVLRGDRARFQLFGDTMVGTKRYIHYSFILVNTHLRSFRLPEHC